MTMLAVCLDCGRVGPVDPDGVPIEGTVCVECGSTLLDLVEDARRPPQPLRPVRVESIEEACRRIGITHLTAPGRVV